MQKLIKISDYYYIVDDKAEIKKDDYKQCQFTGDISKFPNGQHQHKVIATTNPLVNTFMILDIDKELIDKEVQVTFERVYFEKESTIIAIIKPISKETSTNETLEEATKQYCWNKYKPNRRLYAIALEEYIAGYKHCEKTMYSEEELLSYIKRYKDYVVHAGIKFLTFTEWFNNNKK